MGNQSFCFGALWIPFIIFSRLMLLMNIIIIITITIICNLYIVLKIVLGK